MNAHEAIIAGLARAAEKGFTKPADIALAIDIALDEAGLRIVRKPGRKTNFDDQTPHK